MSARRLRRIALSGLMLMTPVFGACSDEPSGPGTLNVAVSGPVALGSIVVEFAGQGLTGVTAAPGDWISSTSGPSSLRVLAVAAETGIIQFKLQVADLSAPMPQATVITGSGPDDRPLLGSGGVEVSISR